jgi:hypothetical protein
MNIGADYGSAVVLFSFSLIIATSTIYVIIARYRFQHADFASGYEGVIAVLAGLFFILPLSVVIVQVASSNQLNDVLKSAVAELDEAEAILVKREEELQTRRCEAQEQVTAAENKVDDAKVAVKAALYRLDGLLGRAISLIEQAALRHDDEAKAGYLTVRSLVDRYPLAQKNINALTPDWSRQAVDALVASLKREKRRCRSVWLTSWRLPSRYHQQRC